MTKRGTVSTVVCGQHYLFRLPPLIVSSDNAEHPAAPTHVQEALSFNQNKPSVADGNKSSQGKSTASATAKLLLRGVRDSADAFGPLKSVAGGLCFILENCEVRASFGVRFHNAYKSRSERRQIKRR